MANILMTTGAPWKHVLRFTFPILAGALLQQLYNTADSIIVGNFTGEGALAAVGTTNTFAFFFLAAAIGISAGNGVLIAQNYGAKNYPMVRKSAATGLLLLGGLGVLASLLGLLLARPAFKSLIAVPEQILDQTVLYFQIYCAGLIFQFGYNILAAIMRSIGDSAATLYFLLIASIVNVALDLLFVAVFRWGVAGAAAATGIAQAFSMAAAWIYMHRRYPVFRYRLRDLRWHNSIAADTFRIGAPIALQLMIVSTGLTAIQRAVNGFGQAMIASAAVGQRVEMYMHLPCNALQTTLATFSGQNIGAGQLERVRQGTRQVIALSIALTLLLSGAAWIWDDDLIALFALSEQAATLCRQHIHAVAITNIVLALYVPVFGVFQGARHCLVPACVATCALTMRCAATYIFKDGTLLGSSIIWWNGLFGYIPGCCITTIYYLSRRWERNACGPRL